MEKVIQISKGKIQQQQNIIIDDLDFELGTDEFAYLIGKTGSGKSSLLKAIYGELKLAEGVGSVAGFNLLTMNKRDIAMLRRKIGVVFQDFQLLMDRNVKQNLLFVLGATGWKDKQLMEKRVKDVLQLTGIEQKMNAMPHTLSGGEQQRVSIARALLNKPSLILADEPTGNLDPETSEEIMRLLIAVAKEEHTAVLMATHDMTMVQKFKGSIYQVENRKLSEITHKF